MPPRTSYQHPADLEPDRSKTDRKQGFQEVLLLHNYHFLPFTQGCHHLLLTSLSKVKVLVFHLPAQESNRTESTPLMISAIARDSESTPAPLAPPIQMSPLTPSPSVSPSSGLMLSPTFQTIPQLGDPTWWSRSSWQDAYSCGQAKSSNLILPFWALPDTQENSENPWNSIILNK